MRIYLIIISLLFCSCFATAQSDRWTLPETYTSTGNKEVATPTSECNRGAEPFSVFLKKWNSSASFRKQRAMVTDVTIANIPHQEDKETLLNYIESLSLYTSVIPLRTYKRNVDTWACWFHVTANTVGYYTTQAGYLLFERVADKWYCVGCNLAG